VPADIQQEGVLRPHPRAAPRPPRRASLLGLQPRPGLRPPIPLVPRHAALRPPRGRKHARRQLVRLLRPPSRRGQPRPRAICRPARVRDHHPQGRARRVRRRVRRREGGGGGRRRGVPRAHWWVWRLP
jgi:hypothetical protein